MLLCHEQQIALYFDLRGLRHAVVYKCRPKAARSQIVKVQSTAVVAYLIVSFCRVCFYVLEFYIRFLHSLFAIRGDDKTRRSSP